MSMETETRGRTLIRKMGYKGEGGLGKNEDGSTTIIDRKQERRGKDKTGIYIRGQERTGLKSAPITQGGKKGAHTAQVHC